MQKMTAFETRDHLYHFRKLLKLKNDMEDLEALEANTETIFQLNTRKLTSKTKKTSILHSFLTSKFTV